MLTAFDHAVIAVRDLGASTATLASLLGRPPSWRGVHPEAGTANALFRLSNAYLELLAPDGDGPLGAVVAESLASQGEGLLALAFGTDDVAEAAKRLSERGVAVAEPQPGEGRGTSGAEPGEQRRRWMSVLLPPDAARGIPILVLEHLSPPELLPVMPADATDAASVRALDHAVVLSDDPAVSARFYDEVLGLRLALDREFPKRGVRLVFFRVGGVTVEVAGPIEPRRDGPGRDRFGGLCYQVPDAAAIRERLLSAGFDVSEVRDGHKPGTRVCTVRGDPCGVPTLLLEPAPRG